MKLVRFARGVRGAWGLIEGDKVMELTGDLYSPGQATGRTHALEDLKILPPSDPSKILIIARNYAEHARELKNDAPPAPVFVCVSPQAALASGEPVIYPAGAERVDYEGELVVIIGRPVCRVSPGEALEYVAGYTCGLDISNRDVQFGPLKNISAAKSYDTFKPFGAFVETDADSRNLEVILRLNGEVRQHASTSDMIFPVSRLISDISHCMTLLPGDIIFTGTPSGVGPVAPGDELEVEIPGLSSLRVRVEADSRAR